MAHFIELDLLLFQSLSLLTLNQILSVTNAVLKKVD